MFKNGYPRLRERKEKESEERRRAAFLSNEDFNPAEFLKIYPNADEYFLNDQRESSDLYIQHANVSRLLVFFHPRARTETSLYVTSTNVKSNYDH